MRCLPNSIFWIFCNWRKVNDDIAFHPIIDHRDYILCIIIHILHIVLRANSPYMDNLDRIDYTFACIFFRSLCHKYILSRSHQYKERTMNGVIYRLSENNDTGQKVSGIYSFVALSYTLASTPHYQPQLVFIDLKALPV